MVEFSIWRATSCDISHSVHSAITHKATIVINTVFYLDGKFSAEFLPGSKERQQIEITQLLTPT